MVLAFIPGMQEFAAAFETIALLAQFVSFACHVALLATGNGGLLDVVVDGIGLVTFGIGKGLIGAAAKTAQVSETVSSVYQDAVKEGTVGSLIKASSKAFESLKAADDWSAWSEFRQEMRETLSLKPVFVKATEALRSGTVSERLLDDPLGHLGSATRLAFSFNSPEVGFALSRATEAAAEMPAAQGVALATTDRIESYYKLFRITQWAGVGTDTISKIDSALNAGHLNMPVYDSIKYWPESARG